MYLTRYIASLDYHKLRENMETTTRTELKELWSASLAPNTSAESFNAMTSDESNKEDAKSKFCFHLGSGYNLRGTGTLVVRAVQSAKSHNYYTKKEAALIPHARQWGIRAERE